MRDTKPIYVPFSVDLLNLDVTYILAGLLDTESPFSLQMAAAFIALVCAFAISRGDDDGQIDFLTDKSIESACLWNGKRGELVRAFMDAGVFIGSRDDDDNPLRIAPELWEMEAGELINKRKAARERKAAQRAKAK